MSNEIVLLRRIEELEKLIMRQPEIGGVWQDWTPTLTGWSANPTGVYRYCQVGKMCTLMINQTVSGTSNSTSTNLTIPFTAAASGNWSAPARILDNGTVQAASGFALIAGSGTVIAFYKTWGAGAWTASGDKRIVSCVLTYEIA